MYDQLQVIERVMKAFDLWPTPAQLTESRPDETRELITSLIYDLEDPYLLAFLWLCATFHLRQQPST